MFLQYLRYDENLDLKAPGVQISIQQSVQKVSWKLAENKVESSSLGAQKAFEIRPKIIPKSKKSGPQRNHPAAPMSLQGAPEVTKWFPRVPK